jgi:hypothetical protein
VIDDINVGNIFFKYDVLTALCYKIKYRDSTVVPAWEVLRRATIEGARAIGLGNESFANELLAADPVHKDMAWLEALERGQL